MTVRKTFDAGFYRRKEQIMLNKNTKKYIENSANLNSNTIEVSKKSMSALAAKLGNGFSEMKMREEMFRKLEEAKAANELVFLAGRYTFPIGYTGEGFLINGIVEKSLSPTERNLHFGFEVTQICNANRNRKAEGYVSEIEEKPAVKKVEKSPKEKSCELKSFAVIESWQPFLESLAAKAVPENWNSPAYPGQRLYILKNYLKFTFIRLMRENKLCISDDRQLAAFNTGLLDRTSLDDIIACFVPNDRGGEQMWKFSGFCTPGSGTIGKKLSAAFPQVPQPASYITADSLYDLSKPLLTDYRHIIIDNVSRLPLPLLWDSKQLQNTLTELSLCNSDKDRERLYGQLRNTIENDGKLFRNIAGRLKMAIELAQKQVRSDYKTAAPCYYPKENTMALMLPLALTDSGKADAALVVSSSDSGSYQGETILTLSDAYLKARLVCSKPEGWLTPVEEPQRSFEMELTA